MSYTYYPEDIADAICRLAGIEDPEIKFDLKSTLYYLKDASENPYNADHFRTTYKALEALCEHQYL